MIKEHPMGYLNQGLLSRERGESHLAKSGLGSIFPPKIIGSSLQAIWKYTSPFLHYNIKDATHLKIYVFISQNQV